MSDLENADRVQLVATLTQTHPVSSILEAYAAIVVPRGGTFRRVVVDLLLDRLQNMQFVLTGLGFASLLVKL